MKSHLKNIPASLIVLASLSIFLSNCAVYDPVAAYTKQRYTNAVAFFNTFYNAQRLFNDAEAEVLKARRDMLERGGSVKTVALPASARQKFQTSIEKNSKVLSFYSDSKWVDDALLMIGKAYFYMEDDVRSQRKFLELAAQFPESDLIMESQLWLGKSLLRQKKDEEGIKQLEDVVAAAPTGDEELAGEAAFELGQYYYARNDNSLAVRQYTVASELVDDSELKAQILFQIGKCYSELQQFDKAAVAYEEAASSSPVYTLLFQSQLQKIKSIAYLKKYDEALELLHEMLDDSKNTEYFGIIHFEIANILLLQGNIPDALVKYRYVDTAFARTDEAARSNYVLAKYYEEHEAQFDSARVLYNKARSEFPASEITKEAAAKADVYNKYWDLRKELNRYDSLYKKEMRPLDDRDSTEFATKDSVAKADSTQLLAVRSPITTEKNAQTKINPDSAANADSLKMKELAARAEMKKKMVDSLQQSIARTMFELGGLFFLELQRPDSALSRLNQVIEHYPSSSVAPRALYTIAEVLRTEKNAAAAEIDTVYQKIITLFPESPYANEARKNLGIPLSEADKDTVLSLFEEAEQLSEAGKYEPAIASFKRIAETYALSPHSAKALYTAGWHYENSVNKQDSAVAVYRRLIEKYPVSTYANRVRPKVAEFDNEIKRLEQEQQKKEEEKKAEEKKAEEMKSAEQKSGVSKPANLSAPSSKDSLSTQKKKP